MRVLVVEDRHVLADSIARSLRREGMAVDVAYDGRAALELAAVNSYEVVVLDRDLPGVRGDDVCRQLAGGQTLTCGDLRLDPNRGLAERAGLPLALTNKELGVLEVLMAGGGRVVSTEELLERMWDAHTDPFSTTVRVTVANLRRKIGDPPMIATVIGAGYRLGTR